MQVNPNLNIPIFVQISKYLSDGILDGSFKEGDRIPSTNELASFFNINPATVLKGVTLLVNQDIVEKKRGLGMFVKEGAKKQLVFNMVEDFKSKTVVEFVNEGRKLGLTKEELVKLIEVEYND